METKGKAADTSVVMALSELVRLEQERIETDREREVQRADRARAERERAEAAAREAEQRRVERAAQEARVAEAEARLRVEADRERDQRIAAMRAELARVELERQTLRANLETRLTTREPARPSGWALAFGLSSLVAASLAGLLVMQQGAQPVALASTQVAAPVAVASPVVSPEPELAALPVVEHTDPVVATAPAPRGHRHRERTQVDSHTTEHGTEIIGLGTDDGGDDVLGPDLVRDAQHSLRP